MSDPEPERTSTKRQHQDTQPGSDNDSDDDMGPQLPSAAAPAKKRRVLPYERAYVDALPHAARYSRSLMHKEPLAFVTATPGTEFFITSSVDGVVKFWKKVAQGIEFVKEYRAHQGEIRCVAVSTDGRSFASAGADGTIKIFDVITFDLLSAITLPGFLPAAICWVHKRGASLPLLAVAEDEKPLVHIYDGRGERDDAVHTIKGLHRTPVCAMAFNDSFDCVVSADIGGMVEYWRPSGGYDKPDNVFEFKSSTSLFDFKKAKAAPCCITVSPTGKQWAALSLPDRKLRIFGFATGKLYRTYDESLEALGEMQQAGTAAQRLETVEFGRRMALEKEATDSATARNRANVAFDESGHFVMYGSMAGIKLINTYTNQVVRVYGRDDGLRAVNLALYQGAPQKKGITTLEMGASNNPLLEQSEARDPILVATAVGKQRFYMFTNDENVSRATRDVQNEKPTTVGARKAAAEAAAAAAAPDSGTAAVMHTTYGDIHLRLFPDAAPKAVENFVTHSRRGYYNGTIFHRVIPKFMIQGGDPLRDGTGGDSIWGDQFEDEFSTLKHDKPYTLSMANAGPNTNGSQFFITTEKTPWLDGKHTIFGRATQGFDVIRKIENARTRKGDKPSEDIGILNIDIT